MSEASASERASSAVVGSGIPSTPPGSGAVTALGNGGTGGTDDTEGGVRTVAAVGTGGTVGRGGTGGTDSACFFAVPDFFATPDLFAAAGFGPAAFFAVLGVFFAARGDFAEPGAAVAGDPVVEPASPSRWEADASSSRAAGTGGAAGSPGSAARDAAEDETFEAAFAGRFFAVVRGGRGEADTELRAGFETDAAASSDSATRRAASAAGTDGSGGGVADRPISSIESSCDGEEEAVTRPT
ncbi:hypothetical protein AVP41_00764 [Microbacterium sp. TNHR37B]|nr:hypothetical protein AVP41_00764 [Microbacterium sp. TNHR37B]